MILITGTSTGIGYDSALYFHQMGFDVWAGVRKIEDQQRLLQDCRQNQERMHPVLLDVTKPEQIHDIIQLLRQSGKPLQALINNAGIVVAGPLELVSLQEFHTQFDVNVYGPLRMIQACLPLLKESKGRIVNISSLAGLSVTPFLGPYCASKFALEALSDALRVELSQFGISVSLIEPGSVDTPIWPKIFANIRKKDHAQYANALDRFEKLTHQWSQNAILTQEVVKAIEHAAFSEKPKTRYLLGKKARAVALRKFLPDRWVDQLLIKLIN